VQQPQHVPGPGRLAGPPSVRIAAPRSPACRAVWSRPAALIVAAAAVLVAAAAVASARQQPAPPRLLTQGIAQDPCSPGRVLAVPPGSAGSYLAGTSVLRTGGGVLSASGVSVPPAGREAACVRAAAAASRRWLRSGLTPGRGAAELSMSRRALLDLRLSVRPDGAVLAGWYPHWEYAWPRDSSWAAVALADSGHPADAFRILRFLRRAQSPDGTWAARYRPDGTGPVRDGRPGELDADGWVPWAVWSWAAAQPAGPAVRRELAQLWPMVSAAADAAARSLTSDGLPEPAMDYWEESVAVTLGTAAPLLAGLRAAADLGGQIGSASARRWADAAARLSAAIQHAFGRLGYHRLPFARSGADAAVAFLGPPFAEPGAGVRRAALRAQAALTLPAGGLRPGTSWPGARGVAWTAETASFALFDAAAGLGRRAAGLLSWLAAHRTRLGALPEQVTPQGRPASVAPLAWTDAGVLLALLAQAHHLPVVPVPPPFVNRG